MLALTDRLEGVESGHITLRYDPGAAVLDRLLAVASGIDRELAVQRGAVPPARAVDLPGRER